MAGVDEAIGFAPDPLGADRALRPLASPLPGVALWRVDLLDASWSDHWTVLSVDEQARAARFVFDHDRRRHRAAHVALRCLLGRRLGCDPSTLDFGAGAHGKPVLVGMACVFNLSHSADVALVAIAEGVAAADPAASDEIGVDVEVMRAVDDLWSLARRNFSPQECDELAALDVAAQEHGFLRCWTRKEACLKAIGSGLSIAPETFDAGVSPAGRWVTIPSLAGTAVPAWQVWVESVEAGLDCLAALARVRAVPSQLTISS